MTTRTRAVLIALVLALAGGVIALKVENFRLSAASGGGEGAAVQGGAQ